MDEREIPSKKPNRNIGDERKENPSIDEGIEKNRDVETEVDQYLNQVKAFKETRPEEAEELLEAKEGHIVYIGRETCPYCRRFVTTLGPLAEERNLTIHYVHSQHPEYEEQVDKIREKYDVPTVPGFLYSSESAGIVVKCDSSMDEKEILDTIEQSI